MYVEIFETESMNYCCFWGDKSDALRLGKKQHGGIEILERLAEIEKLGNVRLQTRNYKLRFAVSHENLMLKVSIAEYLRSLAPPL